MLLIKLALYMNMLHACSHIWNQESATQYQALLQSTLEKINPEVSQLSSEEYVALQQYLRVGLHLKAFTLSPAA